MSVKTGEDQHLYLHLRKNKYLRDLNYITMRVFQVMKGSKRLTLSFLTGTEEH